MASIGLVGNAARTAAALVVTKAYRLASIGLVGNVVLVIGRLLQSTVLTDWLRSDWLETLPSLSILKREYAAYRLASIGLVGNYFSYVIVAENLSFTAYRLASIGLVGNIIHLLAR